MTMKTPARLGRTFTAAIAVLALGLATAEARPSSGGSQGSRGSKTTSAPPPTATAPGTAQPMQRTVTQPGNPGSVAQAPAAQQKGGLFGRPGFTTGLLGGLLGAGLLGALLGGGLTGGLGGVMSFLGLLLQVALIAGVIFLAVRFFRRRSATQTPAYAGGPMERQAMGPQGSGMGMGPAAGAAAGAAGAGALGMMGGAGQAPAQPATAPLAIGPDDYAAFEKLLVDINAAWDAESEGRIRRLATPEMAAYFGEDLSKNAQRGLHDRVKDVTLLQGDLAEAWTEHGIDYATVAMRFSLVNALFERKTGRVVEGDPTKPQEVTEVWTFRRDPGETWVLSAIQQVA